MTALPKAIRRKSRWVSAGILALAAGVLFWCGLPVPRFDDPFSLVLLDRDHRLLGATIAGDEQWRFPPGGAVPEKFITAITCYEDRRFFHHPGVDPLALARAVYDNLRSGRVVSGASTLSMQVVRLSRKGRPRTLWEKCREMVLALRLESALSKTGILALYAAHAPFGGNVVGLEAAAWRYFNRPPDSLSWAETACLAVLPNQPALIHPGRNRVRLKKKRDALLHRLHLRGELDDLGFKLATREPLPDRPRALPRLAPHLLQRLKAARPAPAGQGPSAKPGTQSARVVTTLKRDIQVRANAIVDRHHRHLAANGIHNAAAVIMEVATGRVVAYVGNVPALAPRAHDRQVDVITAPRSTGSVLKPLLYAAMLGDGELLPTQLVPDIPTRIGGFAPRNYSRTYQGAVPAHMALERSLNVPAVRMLRDYGVDRFHHRLKSLGMTTLHRKAAVYGLTLILGGAEGTLEEITAIYAGMARCLVTYAQGRTGVYQRVAPKYIAGDPPWELTSTPPASGVSLDPAACWLTLQAMVEVTRPGQENFWQTFSSAPRVAWKTGTSYGLRDAWAVGVTPAYAVGVWAGNADGEGRPGLTGVGAAAPILFELFGLLPGGPWFAMPEADLTPLTVCANSGYRAGPHCPRTRTIQAPLAGLEMAGCPYCRLVHCDATRTFRVHGDCEPVASIRTEKWFILPPILEWYYKGKHPGYRPPPPFRRDCGDAVAGSNAMAMTLVYPPAGSRIYIPLELDGQRGWTVFEAAHRDPDARIHWHLNDTYLGRTTHRHQMPAQPPPGRHCLTLVDARGARLERWFTVLPRHGESPAQ